MYKNAYVLLAQLVKDKVKLPTYKVYGLSNIGIEHNLQRTQTLAQNKEIPRIKIALKPGRFFPSQSRNCEIQRNLDNFTYNDSPLFQISGNEVDARPTKIADFLNPIKYDSSSDSE